MFLRHGLWCYAGESRGGVKINQISKCENIEINSFLPTVSLNDHGGFSQFHNLTILTSLYAVL